jgi:hypothetical protein
MYWSDVQIEGTVARRVYAELLFDHVKYDSRHEVSHHQFKIGE